MSATDSIPGVFYARVSGPANEDSIPQQRDWARSACRAEGIDLLAEFEDAARSGTEATKRHAFQEMLDYCRQRYRQRQPVRCIVCWLTDRFSRADSFETAGYVQQLREAGVECMFTSKGMIRFDQPEARVLFSISQDLGNHAYSLNQASNSLRGRIANAKDGKWNGGPCPFGLRVVRVLKKLRDAKGREKMRMVPEKLEPHPDTADTLVWIFTSYASGPVSLWRLAQQLNERHVPPPGKAKLWTPTTVRRILINDIYLGTQIWNRRRAGRFFCAVELQPTARTNRTANEEKNHIRDHIRGKKPLLEKPLVPPDLFDRVQKRLLQRQKRTTPRHEHDFRLTGLLRCGHCEGRMLGQHRPLKGKDANGAAVRMFLCGNYARHGRQACHHNAIDEGPLFEAIVKKVREQYLNPTTLERLRATIRRQVARAPSATENERQRLTEKLEGLDGMIAKAARRVNTEDDPRILKACREDLQRLTDDRDRAEQALLCLPSEDPDSDPEQIVDEAFELMRRFEDTLATAEPAAVRCLLGDLLEKVEVFFDHTPSSRGMCCTFAKALVYLREDSPASSFLTISRRGP
jgi:DNA invertase Pin-like site-specific DNA recombinase